MRELRFANVFAFRYSPRPGTAAARWGSETEVPEGIAAERLERLLALQEGIQAEINRGLVGDEFEVLIENRDRKGLHRGRTACNRVMHIEDGEALAPGDYARVRIVRGLPNSLIARLSAAGVRAAQSGPRRAQGASMVKMEIKGLLMDPVSNMPVVILRDKEDGVFLPIWVGIFEANAIAIEMEGIQAPRPMTHDLLRDVLGALGIGVDRVVVTELKENTFFARIELSRGSDHWSVDSRPSDAIALALRTDSEIFVEEEVLEKSKNLRAESAATDPERLKKWLEEVSPEDLGKYRMGNYARMRGLQFVALRFAQIYGPGKLQRHGPYGLFSQLVESPLAGRPVKIPRGGDQRDDVIYVDDIAEAIVSNSPAPATCLRCL